MATSFYTDEELKEIGFKKIGENVLLSKKTSIYGAGNISIGSNVRIDDFCIISGNIQIGNYVHIAAACLLFGGESGIVMEDFTSISSRSAVYAESDDYSGEALVNPTIPNEFRKINGGTVVMERHALLGTGCTVLPGVTVGEGTSVGSMSLISKSLEPWSIYVGIPCKRIKNRSKRILELEKELLKSEE